MTILNPQPEPPHQRPMSLDMAQAPAHVWAQLSPVQRQQVYHSLAQVCRHLVHQITSQEQPHDHH
jgi:hypothetical protein